MLLYTPSFVNDRDASTSTEGREHAMKARGLKADVTEAWKRRRKKNRRPARRAGPAAEPVRRPARRARPAADPPGAQTGLPEDIPDVYAEDLSGATSGLPVCLPV